MWLSTRDPHNLGHPPIPPYRFPADTKPHTSAESCFLLLGNIYPPKPNFPLQCLFGGSPSPSCSSLGGGGGGGCPVCLPYQPLPSCTRHSSGLGPTTSFPWKRAGRAFSPAPSTQSRFCLFAKRWAPASAGRHASNIEGINSCEWVNNDFPGGDEQHSHSSPGAWQGKVQCQ